MLYVRDTEEKVKMKDVAWWIYCQCFLTAIQTATKAEPDNGDLLLGGI